MTTIDYNTIAFEIFFDIQHQHSGILSLYRRVAEEPMDVEMLNSDTFFLGLIINLSGHEHHYSIGENKHTLSRGKFNFFYIPAGRNLWGMGYGMNSIVCLQFAAGFLPQFVGEVPILAPFLHEISLNLAATLTAKSVQIPPSIFDDLVDMMRDRQFIKGEPRDMFIHQKLMKVFIMALQTSQLSNERPLSVAEVAEVLQLRRLHKYIVDNVRFISDTRTLTVIVPMHEKALNIKFKRLFGKTMAKTLRDERLKKAKELLVNTALSICEIAERVGYGGASALMASFKERYGVGPTEFRGMEG